MFLTRSRRAPYGAWRMAHASRPSAARTQMIQQNRRIAQMALARRRSAARRIQSAFRRFRR